MSDDERIRANGGHYDASAVYWETHDVAECWDETEAVDFEIAPDARFRYLVALDPAVFRRAQRLAGALGVGVDALVNTLVAERLAERERPA